MSKNVSEILNTSMERIRDMVDANTVVGTPIAVNDQVTLIPISKISFGLASGGSDFGAKAGASNGSFIGGSGCGVKIVPVAFVVLQGEHVRVLPITEPAANASERLIEQLPDYVDRITGLFAQKKEDISDR